MTLRVLLRYATHGHVATVDSTCVQAEMESILKDYVGRETPLYYAERLSEYYKRCVALLPAQGWLRTSRP